MIISAEALLTYSKKCYTPRSDCTLCGATVVAGLSTAESQPRSPKKAFHNLSRLQTTSGGDLEGLHEVLAILLWGSYEQTLLGRTEHMLYYQMRWHLQEIAISVSKSSLLHGNMRRGFVDGSNMFPISCSLSDSRIWN